MRRKYDKMLISSVALSLEGSMLIVTSVTTTKVKVNDVVVEDYHNGFDDDAPFETISFD